MAEDLVQFSLDWNDAALVTAYDKAVGKCKVVRMTNGYSSKDGKEGKSSDMKEPEFTWIIGDYCRNVYSEDGEIYEAEILVINEEKGTCIIRYIGYNNDEEVFLKDLMPSEGRHARQMQSDVVEAEVRNMWKVGEFCQAIYSADGEFYEAVIEEVGEDSCVVKFVGYDDTETVDFSDMQPSEGHLTRFEQQQKAKKAIKKAGNSRKQSNTESNQCSSSSKKGNANGSNHEETVQTRKSWATPSCPIKEESPMSTSTHQKRSTRRRLRASGHRSSPICRPIIPPIPPILDDDPINNQALSHTLMSWYMAGYEIGYHQGFKKGQELCNCEEESCDCEHSMHC